MRPDRRVVHAYGVGHAIAIELDQIAVDVAIDDVIAESPLNTGLERVAAGHVGGGAGRDVLLRIDTVGREADAVTLRAEHQVLLADRAEPFRRAAVLADAGLVMEGDVFDVGRVPRLEQQAARDGRGPLCLPRVVERLVRVAPIGGRFRLVERRQLITFELGVPVVVHGDLVPRRSLPRQPDQLVLHPLLLLAGRAVPEEAVGDEFVRGNAPPRGEEPQLVTLDRPAEPDVEVRNEIDAVAGTEAALTELGGHVVALPVPGAAPDEGRSAEGVAAFPRDHVDPDVAG